MKPHSGPTCLLLCRLRIKDGHFSLVVQRVNFCAMFVSITPICMFLERFNMLIPNSALPHCFLQLSQHALAE